MTAIPHHGSAAARLRRVATNRAGARLIRPSRVVRPARTPAEPETAVAASVAIARPSASLSSVRTRLGLQHLRVVVAGGRIRMGQGAFLIAVLASLTGMLAGLLFLNTALAETSFRLTEIRTEMRELTVREQVLSTELAAAESPIGLEEQAKALGMVAAGSPLFLDLSEGVLLGEQTPADPYSALAIPPKFQKPMAAGETTAELVSPGSPAAGSVNPGAGNSGSEVETPAAPSSTSSFVGEQELGISRGTTR